MSSGSQVQNEYPFGFDDARRFHGIAICFVGYDWRDGCTRPLYGVLDSAAGYPRIKMQLKRPGEYPNRPGHELYDHKVVDSYSFWSTERKEAAQAEDKANFRFRPASREECAGMTFAYSVMAKIAEDHPEVLEKKPAKV